MGKSINKFERKINYYETDRMGIVHHSNYIRFMEEARCAWLESIDMPFEAMEIQTILVAVIVLVISFGGKSAKAFFELLVLMTNVAMTIPYLFLSAAFISFKKKDNIKKPFEIYKNYNIAFIFSIIVTVTVAFANIFTIIEPALKGDYISTLAMIAGPLIFTLVALYIYNRGEKK